VHAERVIDGAASCGCRKSEDRTKRQGGIEMGARLVVSIEKGGIEICNVYFHWSANTLDAYR